MAIKAHKGDAEGLGRAGGSPGLATGLGPAAGVGSGGGGRGLAAGQGGSPGGGPGPGVAARIAGRTGKLLGAYGSRLLAAFFEPSTDVRRGDTWILLGVYLNTSGVLPGSVRSGGEIPDNLGGGVGRVRSVGRGVITSQSASSLSPVRPDDWFVRYSYVGPTLANGKSATLQTGWHDVVVPKGDIRRGRGAEPRET
nr:uncharacterized protein LOC112294269 [Physcomitrium patens]|eukprot:XP_024400332.1 uncharacterized protein LOC112294269 [Physcomitrella patens]